MSGLTTDREIFCRSFFKAETPGWELAPWSSHGVMLYCLKIWHMVPPQPEKEKEKARLELESWQLEACVVWPLLYAALGKTRECGASEVSGLPHQDTSSTRNLFLFFFFLYIFSAETFLDPFFDSFLLAFFCFLLYVRTLFWLCLTKDWEKLLYGWFLWDMTCCLLPFLSSLAVFL